MVYLIERIVPGFMFLLLLFLAWERLLFSRIFDDPVKGKLASAASAWLMLGTIVGFGMTSYSSFTWRGFKMLSWPAIVLAGLAFVAGLRMRREMR